MTHESREIELGEFLRTRRSRINPDQVALPSSRRRRVPGLRREEVALLAGVSASYYTRIEQGTVSGVSASVLRSLAQALALNQDEEAQLYRLAQQVHRRDAIDQQALAPSLDLLLSRLPSVPAAVLGHGMRVLAWNRLAHAVFAQHRCFEEPWSAEGLNWARTLFLDQATRRLFRDWDAVALDLVGRMRAAAAMGTTPDPELPIIVEELCASSPDFASLWSAHPVRERPLGEVWLDHPELGALSFIDSVLKPAERDGQAAFVFHPVPGTGTDRKLQAIG